MYTHTLPYVHAEKPAEAEQRALVTTSPIRVMAMALAKETKAGAAHTP